MRFNGKTAPSTSAPSDSAYCNPPPISSASRAIICAAAVRLLIGATLVVGAPLAIFGMVYTVFDTFLAEPTGTGEAADQSPAPQKSAP